MKNNTKQEAKKWKIAGFVLLGVFGLGLILAVAGLSRSMKEIEEIEVAKTPEAILTNVDVEDGKNVAVAVSYFDQKADECVNLYDGTQAGALAKRQFEWTQCGYFNKKLEQGIVDYYLGEDYYPVFNGGKLLSNRGVDDVSRWFAEVEGKSQSYLGVLNLNYDANRSEYTFLAEDFYPIDNATFSNGDATNHDGHNHLFTMNFAVPFSVLASGDEEFEITADDDTFVFVGNELALDMGGVHEPVFGKIMINEDGEVYTSVGEQELAYAGIDLRKSDYSIIRIFHADRDSDGSTFAVNFRGMNLSIADTKIAGEDGGVQIAYDPNEPSFVAPLGENQKVGPDLTRGYLVIAIAEGVAIFALSILAVLTVNTLRRRR